jgi:hypothetical protein
MATAHVEKKKWYKRWWVWVLIVFGVFIFIGIFSPSENNTSSSGTKPISEGSTNSAVISGNLESFFPTREEIPTEFAGGTITDLVVANVTGLNQAKSMSIEKIEGTMGAIVIDMFINEFSSQEQAKSYYDFLVNEKKQAGGYSEMSVSSHSTCFGYTEDYGISAQYANVLCYNKNVYFEVDGVSASTFKKPNNDVKTMLSIIDGKIK